jgi:DNA polymerase-1
MSPRPVAVDFETKKIEDRPEYPPEPVGVAIRDGSEKVYLAWGHPDGNNCTKREAIGKIKTAFKGPCVFHNATFDVEVAVRKLGLDPPKSVDDTLVMSFLDDPRSLSLGLKEWAAEHLNMPADEQNELKLWILENVPGSKKSDWGAYISEAPGGLVGKYAIGDVDRTLKAYDVLEKRLKKAGMLSAYQREMEVMPIFMTMSRDGIKVAVSRLARDLKKAELEIEFLHRSICRALKVKDLNLDAPNDFADALESAGKVTEWVKTAKGKRSVSRENLLSSINDSKLMDTINRHGMLSTCVTTFFRPWLEIANRAGGRIYPTFHQTRNADNTRGTRTGRPSSTKPNLLNVPKDPFDPDKPWTANLPNMRDYLVPDDDCVFLIRDYDQQELRILAHYEDGRLLQEYLDDPSLDVHNFVQRMIRELTGVTLARKPVKILNFGVIYGMGIPGISRKLDIDADEAKHFKGLHSKALPGVSELAKLIKSIVKSGEPIRTWGGRLYYVEEPFMKDGRLWTFDYKMLNYLIQGSAADITKQAMINISKRCSGRTVLQVYDEVIQCVPKDEVEVQMKEMREAMFDIEGIDVPMLSTGALGIKSWGSAKKYLDPKDWYLGLR